MAADEISISLNGGSDDYDDDFSNGWTGDSIQDETTVNGEDAKVKAAREERQQLGSRETRAVRTLRLITLLVLLIATVLLTVGIYKVIRDDQKETFQRDYDSGANKIIDSFHKSVQQVLDSFDTASTTMTSYALDTGATFPNVTVPHFETRGATTRIMSQSFFLMYTPLISDNNRPAWESYANDQHAHMMQSYLDESNQKFIQDETYQESEQDDNATTESDNNTALQQTSLLSGFSKHIWGSTGLGEVEEPGTGPYLPLWQISPAIPVLNYMNFNILDLEYFGGPCSDVLQSGLASFGIITHGDDPTDENGQIKQFISLLLSLGQYRHTLEEYAEDPITVAAYPVFDKLTKTDRKVVGVFTSSLYWRILFQGILPDDSKNDFTVVVHNSLEQAETFRLHGAQATYVGMGDLHDHNFNHMKTTATVSDYLKSNANPETRSFTTVELRSEYVSYRIAVYANEELESHYLTPEPIYYSIAVASTFVFTAFVFLLYNWIVERRQRLVLDKAAKSTAVVKSLFPEKVQERLYEETEERKPTHDKNGWKNPSKLDTRDLNTYLSSGEFRLADHRTNSKTPIADLFPAATIVFADLVGFTRWSSGRKATDVFGLLEAIYGAFDSVAKKRGVFKVETIGDCYVAVTGVPEAQADHAVRMAKFATECMLRLKKLLPTLTEMYGTRTKNLSMRIGLHSGPVTAGVLRGDRGRFQLFGDTVNTAARMESNGSPGRIHCSESTAQELRDAARASWARPRETAIQAKGKGKMQTYWVFIPSNETLGSKSTNTSGQNEEASGQNDEAPGLSHLSKHDSTGGKSLGYSIHPIQNYLFESSASTNDYEGSDSDSFG